MEWYRTTADLIYGGLCWTLILTCIICAVFRWFHLCGMCEKDPDYYYPARKWVCAFFLCQLLFLPFVLRPSEPHTILYTRGVGLLLTTAFLPLILNRFFRQHAKIGNFYRYYLYVCPLVAFAIVGLATLISPENFFLARPIIFLMIVGGISFVMCAILAHISIWLWQRIGQYHKAEYSNEEDFPYKFAQKVLFLPWVVILFWWIVFFTGNEVLMAVLWGVISVFAVYYTLTILHPQRVKPAHTTEEGLLPQDQDIEAAIDTVEENELPLDSPTEGENQSGQAVRLKVIEIARARYLEPHLTRRDIIAEFDYGERTMAGAIISTFGFYDMINTLRLAHARCYAEAHPNETKESVAVSSGFKDRFAMRHAARRIGEGNSEILDGFVPEIL